jgi:hypothetical protein
MFYKGLISKIISFLLYFVFEFKFEERRSSWREGTTRREETRNRSWNAKLSLTFSQNIDAKMLVVPQT